MANYIFKRGVDILRCSNWAMEAFYEKLKKIIELRKLENNEIIMDFIEQLDQNIYGRGGVFVEITDYFDNSANKLPLNLLFELVDETIENMKREGTFESSYIDLLEEFKNKIL